MSMLHPAAIAALLLAASSTPVLAQDYPADHLEILLVDGMSTDRTRGLAAAVLADRIADRSARVLDNRNGSAPGQFLDHHGKWVYIMPGPFNEMSPIFEIKVRS